MTSEARKAQVRQASARYYLRKTGKMPPYVKPIRDLVAERERRLAKGKAMRAALAALRPKKEPKLCKPRRPKRSREEQLKLNAERSRKLRAANLEHSREYQREYQRKYRINNQERIRQIELKSKTKRKANEQEQSAATESTETSSSTGQ